jgi:NADPH2:quinone reductase
MTDYLAPIHKGDHVLIHAAAGGVGSFLIQLAKLKGAIVYAKIGDDSKIELVKSLGADFVINYKKTAYEETLKSLLKTDRLSASYNAVAGSTFKKDVALLGSGGKLFLFGGAEIIGTRFGIFSTLNFLRKMGLLLPIGLLMRSKSILGVNMLKIADNRPDSLTECLGAVIDLYRKIELKTHVGGRFSVKEIAQAHTLLQAGKTTGKLSVFWED